MNKKRLYLALLFLSAAHPGFAASVFGDGAMQDTAQAGRVGTNVSKKGLASTAAGLIGNSDLSAAKAYADQVAAKALADAKADTSSRGFATQTYVDDAISRIPASGTNNYAAPVTGNLSTPWTADPALSQVSFVGGYANYPDFLTLPTTVYATSGAIQGQQYTPFVTSDYGYRVAINQDRTVTIFATVKGLDSGKIAQFSAPLSRFDTPSNVLAARCSAATATTYVQRIRPIFDAQNFATGFALETVSTPACTPIASNGGG